MKLKAYRHMGDPEPVITEASMVLVEDDNGTPIMIACRLGKDHRSGMETIIVSQAGDDEFQDTLRSLGIDRLVVVEDFDKYLEARNP